MKAEIICIGDELLIGQTVNSNAAFIGELLTESGYQVLQALAISDKADAITGALSDAMRRSSLVIITGGLGPTRDDVTKLTLAGFFGSQLVSDEATLARIEAFFASRNLPVLDINRHQALVPDNCVVLHNLKGTANGMWFERDGTVVVALPGVPYEMKWLIEQEVLPRLKLRHTGQHIVSRTYLTQGVGESFIADKISRWEDDIRENGLSLAYLPSPGRVKLRLTATGADATQLNELLDEKEKPLLDLIGDIVYGRDRDTLAGSLQALFKERGLSLGVAESCTGGRILHELTKEAGASLYLRGGVVAYNKDLKINILGVPEALASHDIYSEDCALAMARGIRQITGATLGVGITGVAGPGPDPAYPGIAAGYVAMAIAGHGWHWSAAAQFGRERKRVMEMACNTLLFQLRREILARTTV